MTRALDAIVVGLGVMGAAAASALARRGARVLGIERFGIPNTRGSSHGRTRIFRVAYYEHPDYVPLLLKARDLWKSLEREARQTILHPTGGLWMGRADGSLVGGTRRATLQHNLPHEILTAEQIRRRWPQFRVSDDYVGFLEDDAGALRAEAATDALIKQAEAAGAQIRTHERVLRWSATSGAVTVETDRASYSAERLVLTAGPWTSMIVNLPRVRLSVSRQPSIWTHPHRPAALSPDNLPCWAVERSDQSFFYGFPFFEDDRGFKISVHEVRESVDPETVDRTIRPDEIEFLAAALRQILPDADGPLESTSICLYTNSPDGHFILDRHPQHENVLIASGFSGHGFKFGPVIGEALADLALDGTTTLPIEFLSLRRLSATPR